MFVKVIVTAAVAAVAFGFAYSPSRAASPEAAATATRAPVSLLARSAASRHLPGLRANRLRSTAALAYTVHAVGAPTADSEPTGFNNTGQMFGQGTTGCFVYDGGSFQRLPIPSQGIEPGYSFCRVTAINDATSDGTFEVGGTTQSTYAAGTYAFAVTRGASIVYYAYSDSIFLGVNDNGVSLAVADFSPVRTTDLAGEQLFTALDGAGYLTQLQAPVSAASPVHYLLPLQDDYGEPCAFGGCYINNQNQILGYDYASITATTASLAVSTLGSPASLVALPIEVNGGYGSIQCCNPVAFNDRDQILYNANLSEDYGTGTPAVYDMVTNKKTTIPLVTPSCPKGGYGVPLSMNNSGEVLGAYYCTNFGGYFTWDAATGTHDLSLQIPATNFTLYPVGINDNGQILIGLLAAGNPDSWGTLDPIVPSVSQKARKYRRVRM